MIRDNSGNSEMVGLNLFLTSRSRPPLLLAQLEPVLLLPCRSLPILPPMRNTMLHCPLPISVTYCSFPFPPFFTPKNVAKLLTSLPCIVGEHWNMVSLNDEVMGNSNTHYER